MTNLDKTFRECIAETIDKTLEDKVKSVVATQLHARLDEFIYGIAGKIVSERAELLESIAKEEFDKMPAKNMHKLIYEAVCKRLSIEEDFD